MRQNGRQLQDCDYCVILVSRGTNIALLTLWPPCLWAFYSQATSPQTPLPSRRWSVPATRFHAPVLIFAGMQHLPAIRNQVSAFVSLLDARAPSALTGMELLTARH